MVGAGRTNSGGGRSRWVVARASRADVVAGAAGVA